MKTKIPKHRFKSHKAYLAFIKEAMVLESAFVQKLARGDTQRLQLYADDETGHIIMWFKENEPVYNILDEHYRHLFRKVIWEVRGGENREGDAGQDAIYKRF